jgi:hypothetical protein
VKKSLPADAFSHFVALGPARTHQAVADHFDVNIRTVQRTAKTDNWAARLDAIEKEARQTADKALAEDVAEMQLRHRKLLRAMAARSAKAMSDFPLTDGMQAIKAAEIVIKLERLLAGEPTERTSVNIEETIKREYGRWLERGDEEAAEGGDDGGTAQATE